MKKDEQGLSSIVWAFQHLWRYRKGHEPVGRLLDALDGLWLETKTGLRPVLAHEHRTPVGWHLVFHLPPGISSRQIRDKADHLEEQAGGEIQFRLIGQKLHMDLSLVPLPTNAPYVRDPKGYEGMKLPVPLGVTRQGPLVVEIADKPHVLIGGNTGSGKTTTLRVLVVSLLMAGAEVVIVDLKGGLDFSGFRSHCSVVTSDREAEKVMKDLLKECERRIPILEEARVTSLIEYPGDDLPFIVLVVDEMAQLRRKESQQALNELARLSRSAGICLVCATQRPSSSIFASTVFSDTRMLFGGRLCFWVPKPEDSKMVLDDDSASRLPPEAKGRAIWQWAGQRQVQCYNLTLKDAQGLLATIPEKEVLFGERRGKKLPPGPAGPPLP